MILENDGVASKTTKEKVKSLALKPKVTRKQTSDDSDRQRGSDEDVDEKESEAFNLIENTFHIIDLQKENDKLLKFIKDFSKTYEKLLQEKRALEKEHSKHFSKVNELNLEVKKLDKSKEVVNPCKKCDVLTKEIESLECNISKLQNEALKIFKKSS
nr:hypothetical protein [Tanacetum cinerariifolium]